MQFLPDAEVRPMKKPGGTRLFHVAKDYIFVIVPARALAQRALAPQGLASVPRLPGRALPLQPAWRHQPELRPRQARKRLPPPEPPL